MIEIQIQLATVSVLLFLSAVVAIAPGVLGLILGISCYSSSLKHIQIPACLISGSSILIAIIQFSGMFWTFKAPQLGIQLAATLLMAGAGLYYVCERIAPITTASYQGNIPASQTFLQTQQLVELPKSSHYRLEISFVCLWLLSLMITLVLTTYCICVSWAEYRTKNESLETYPDLDKPIDIPFIPTSTQGYVASAGIPSLKSRASWAPTVNSVGRSISFGSLQSAMEEKNLSAPPKQDQNADCHSHANASQRSQLFSSQGEIPHPDTPKGPKSPLRIQVSRSSFSLRRSQSKLSQHQGPQSLSPLSAGEGPQNLKSKHLSPIHITQPGDLVSLAVSQGVSPLTYDPGSPRSWVIIPNENVAESRSVSGSSQLTGRVFPASDYNRKINAAGFQKDEPVPINLSPSRLTFSQYDLQRISKTRI